MKPEKNVIQLVHRKRKLERHKRERQPELVLVAEPAVAVKKRPRAIAGAVEILPFLLNVLKPVVLVRELGPHLEPARREEWERWEERGVR